MTSADGVQRVCAEFAWRPPPTETRGRAVFDEAMRSRLSCLGAGDTVLLIAADDETIAGYQPYARAFPHLTWQTVIANSALDTNPPGVEDDPYRLGWDAPHTWRGTAMTDRWARVLVALGVGEQRADRDGWLIMPAHDAVWGEALLPMLERLSIDGARGGMNAAVSPLTPFQHSSVPGADIAPDVIALINAAFGRDVTWPQTVARGGVQAFWGKMAMVPFAMCRAILDRVDTTIWEDDHAIDAAIDRAGLAAHAVWIDDPDVYRQALPVWEHQGARRVIDRHLHYSINSESVMTQPLNEASRAARAHDPAYGAASAAAELLIVACAAALRDRLARLGASWVDWGAYRLVVRRHDPGVAVWKRAGSSAIMA